MKHVTPPPIGMDHQYRSDFTIYYNRGAAKLASGPRVLDINARKDLAKAKRVIKKGMRRLWPSINRSSSRFMYQHSASWCPF